MRRYGIRKTIRRVTTVFSFGLASLAIVNSASARFGMPGGITDEAREIENLYLFMLAMAVLVFVGVVGALLYAIIRFRRRDENEIPPQTHGSNIIEMIWTGIPVAIVIALFTYSFIVLQRVENDANPEDMTVDVEGFQFQWNFAYSLDNIGEGSDPESDEQIIIRGTPGDHPELVVPIDEPIEFVLHSNDVIHSFYVRDFNYKLDVIPGRDNRFSVTIRETGTYLGFCAELCGIDHALMRFTLRAVERDEFDAWIDEMREDEAAVRGR